MYHMKINLSVNQYEQELGKIQQLHSHREPFRPFWDSSVLQGREFKGQHESQLFIHVQKLCITTDSNNITYRCTDAYDKLSCGLIEKQSCRNSHCQIMLQKKRHLRPELRSPKIYTVTVHGHDTLYTVHGLFALHFVNRSIFIVF